MNDVSVDEVRVFLFIPNTLNDLLVPQTGLTRQCLAIKRVWEVSCVGTLGGDCSGCARSGGQPVPAGPGRFALPLRLRRTGHGRGAGSGRVQPPDTGQPRGRVCEHSTRVRAVDRNRAGCIFTSRCVGAPSMRSRRRPAGSDVAACAVRAGCSPFGRLPSPLVRPGCRGYWGFAVLTPSMPRSGAHSGLAVRPAGPALKLGRDELWVRGHPARTGLPHEAFPLRLRRTGQARAGPGAVLFRRVLALCGLAVAVCDAVHHHIPPGRAASAPRPLPLRLPTDGGRRGADPR